MTPEKLLDKLNIFMKGYYQNDDYVIDIDNDDDFGRVFSLLDSSNYVQNIESELELEGSKLTYIGEGYQLILESNFDDNVYKLTLSQLKQDKSE